MNNQIPRQLEFVIIPMTPSEVALRLQQIYNFLHSQEYKGPKSGRRKDGLRVPSESTDFPPRNGDYTIRFAVRAIDYQGLDYNERYERDRVVLYQVGHGHSQGGNLCFPIESKSTSTDDVKRYREFYRAWYIARGYDPKVANEEAAKQYPKLPHGIGHAVSHNDEDGIYEFGGGTHSRAAKVVGVSCYNHRLGYAPFHQDGVNQIRVPEFTHTTTESKHNDVTYNFPDLDSAQFRHSERNPIDVGKWTQEHWALWGSDQHSIQWYHSTLNPDRFMKWKRSHVELWEHYKTTREAEEELEEKSDRKTESGETVFQRRMAALRDRHYSQFVAIQRSYVRRKCEKRTKRLDKNGRERGPQERKGGGSRSKGGCVVL